MFVHKESLPSEGCDFAFAILHNFSKVHDVYFSDRVDQTLEVFIDDFLVFEESYDDYLQNLENVLKKCEEINL